MPAPGECSLGDRQDIHHEMRFYQITPSEPGNDGPIALPRRSEFVVSNIERRRRGGPGITSRIASPEVLLDRRQRSVGGADRNQSLFSCEVDIQAELEAGFYPSSCGHIFLPSGGAITRTLSSIMLVCQQCRKA
jgi:hypothetical protein